MSGYSGTPLARKLGLKDGLDMLLLDVPEPLRDIHGPVAPAHLARTLVAGSGRRHDFIHVFETSRARLEDQAGDLTRGLKPSGSLWISWPKKSSRVATTLTEDVLREIFLPTGLVDTKVCAVDEIWSGLKFMFRKEARAGLSGGD